MNAYIEPYKHIRVCKINRKNKNELIIKVQKTSERCGFQRNVQKTYLFLYKKFFGFKNTVPTYVFLGKSLLLVPIHSNY